MPLAAKEHRVAIKLGLIFYECFHGILGEREGVEIGGMGELQLENVQFDCSHGHGGLWQHPFPIFVQVHILASRVHHWNGVKLHWDIGEHAAKV